MSNFLYILKEYWFLISFILVQLTFAYKFYQKVKQSQLTTKEATKCSLRNDILEIFDRCKDNKIITRYELEAIIYSSELYFALGGNSFIKEIVEQVKAFNVID